MQSKPCLNTILNGEAAEWNAGIRKYRYCFSVNVNRRVCDKIKSLNTKKNQNNICKSEEPPPGVGDGCCHCNRFVSG